MVLGVCRNLLCDPNDVDDAFQATLLVLVRKASSIHVDDSLGPWIHAVAYRVAVRARAKNARRFARERPETEAEPLAPARDPDRHELPPLLHHELSRLPERYRAPIVLCHLEGLTHDLAAQQLRWPVGTVRSRLSRARALLRDRLARRGFTVSGATLGVVLSQQSASAMVPSRLSEATLKAALRIAANPAATAGVLSAPAAALTEGVLRSMLTTKLKTAAAGLLAAGIIATGVTAHSFRAQAAEGAEPVVTTVTEQNPAKAPAPKALAIEAKLNQPVSFDFNNQALAKAISSLAKYTGLNIVLDPQALADTNVTTATPVNVVAKDIKLKTALKLMLKPLGLGYKVEDDVLMITSPSALLSKTYPKTYYVGDLVMPPNTRVDGNSRPKVEMSPLIKLLTSSVARGTWRVNDPSGTDNSQAFDLGGDAAGVETATPIGSITPFYLSVSLIIRHTEAVHDQIADRLRFLREFQDQVQFGSGISRVKIDARNEEPSSSQPRYVAYPPKSGAKSERIGQLLKELEEQVNELTRERDQLQRERDSRK